MTSILASRSAVRRVRFVSVFGAFCAVAVVPGSIFAGEIARGPHSGEALSTAEIDRKLIPVAGSQTGEAGRRSGVAAVTAPKFDMSHVERIRLRVLGYSDLGGDYTIHPDNTLSIPRVGRIDVSNMGVGDLELMLADKLSAATRMDVTVAIEIAQFRSYFIMGQVAEAGALEWRPGLKVIQAISLARGVLRQGEGGAEPVQSSSAGRQSRTQLTFALAQLARLKAEREGGNVVASNERVLTLINSVPETSRMALTRLISRQNDMLAEQRNIVEGQVDGLRREREAAERELQAAETQEKAIREQLQITRAQLADIEGLKEKKLVSNSRYLEQKSALLLIEVRYSEVKSLVERARVRLETVDQQLVMVPQQRRAALSERIDTLEREVAQLELTSGIQANFADGSQDEDVLKLRYHIARETEKGVRTFPASVFTEVLPGDVLIVSEGQQDRTGAVRGPAGRQPGVNDAKDNGADEAQRRIEDAAANSPTPIFRRTSEAGRSVR